MRCHVSLSDYAFHRVPDPHPLRWGRVGTRLLDLALSRLIGFRRIIDACTGESVVHLITSRIAVGYSPLTCGFKVAADSEHLASIARNGEMESW